MGRAYLHGLMAGGRAGVDRTIAILPDHIVRNMKLLEVASIEELNPAHVTQLEHFTPRAPSRVREAASAAKTQAKRRAATTRTHLPVVVRGGRSRVLHTRPAAAHPDAVECQL